MVGILCALAFSQWVTVAHLPSRTSSPEPKASRYYRQAQTDKTPSSRESVERRAYDPGCPDPQSREDADLCEQRRMADATVKTVALADSQYRWNVAQAVGTIVAALAAALAAVFAGMAAKQAGRSTDVARETLIASERAWVKRIRIYFSSSLDFREDGLVFSSIAFEFTNVGNAPALHVQMAAWLLPITNGGPPERRAKELFEERRNHPVSGGFTLFPGDSYPRNRDIQTNELVVLTPEEAVAAADNAGRLSLYLAACISYAFSADPAKYHQTSCLFQVEPTTGIFITADRRSIPETELRLQESGFLGMDLAD